MSQQGWRFPPGQLSPFLRRLLNNHSKYRTKASSLVGQLVATGVLPANVGAPWPLYRFFGELLISD